MVVQHNLTAMNSNRNLGITTSAQAKSTEKLSSGYKINRAADDAAGLSISEKMRKQIRGLTQASANAEDGISTVQTAEGALNEVQDMLQRMNELAVKASNGTMSESDRSYVQNEVDQLVTEIDRVSTTTKFNETYLLQGDASGKSGTTDQIQAIAGKNATLAANTVVKSGDYSLGTVGIAKAATGSTSAAMTNVKANGDTTKLADLLNQSTNGTVTFTATAGTSGTAAEKNAATSWNVTVPGGSSVVVSQSELASYGIGFEYDDSEEIANGNTMTFSKELVQSNTQTQTLATQGITYDVTGVAAANITKIDIGKDLLTTLSVDSNGKGTIGVYDKAALPNALELSLHVGADSTNDNKISLSIATMSAKGLGLKTDTGAAIKVDGKDSSNADAAINTIAAAIQKVSTQRSSLGAIQNRLEHTINNLDNVVENTTSAESSIRDTDMATEMVKYSNNNILTQAGQAMLAQANQSNQGVLSLLQ